MSDGVVIVGGGLAAHRCAETLRRGGYQERVRIVAGERHLPYDRPPLSKEMLLDPLSAASTHTTAFRSEEWYAERGIELLRGVRAVALDPERHVLSLDDDTSAAFDSLVLATGARPRTLAMFEGYANVSTLRTREEALALRGLLDQRRKIAVIGAGFIGQEVACAARHVGAQVTLVEIEAFPLHGLLGAELGRWFAQLHEAAGVELALGCQVESVRGDGAVEALILDDGTHVDVDHVLVAVGVTPDVGWLEACGIASAGVRTDASGASELADVYAAGDCAAVYDSLLERHILSGHWEAASRQGIQVAHTILGRETSTPSLPSFWSDQYGTRIQYLGHAQLADSVELDGDPRARDFVARYRRDGELVAALAVGRPRALAELRDELSGARAAA